MTDVEWRPVPEWSMYEISEHGDVRNIRSGRVLRQTFQRTTGYMHVGLRAGWRKGFEAPRKEQTFSVHRLVCRAFHGEPPSPRHIPAHRNGKRVDNCKTNLRWATPKENHADRELHGTAPFGERNPRARLTREQALAIVQSPLSAARLAKQFGVSESAVQHVKTGKNWSSITGKRPKP